jgi:glucokinase
VLIAGDIGGTRARLTLLAPGGKVARHEVFESRAFPSLEAVVRSFLGKRAPRVTAAAFGVAGPVVKGRCVATNLPWVIDERVMARKLRIKRVKLLNDLVALSLGALGVPRRKLHPLGGAGVPRKNVANIAVIAAGTGLGQAMLVWSADHGEMVASPTEGGHSDFAPADDVQAELQAVLRARFGHVSWERILSGNGLGALYEFFRDTKGIGETAENRAAVEAAQDRNAAIGQLGLDGKSDAATRAVELFVHLYGAEAGNLALKTLAVGGVYVCGNIAAKMLSVIDRGGFRQAFEDKGRFRGMMEKIPVAVVLDSDVGLAGAKSVAIGR